MITIFLTNSESKYEYTAPFMTLSFYYNFFTNNMKPNAVTKKSANNPTLLSHHLASLSI